MCSVHWQSERWPCCISGTLVGRAGRDGFAVVSDPPKDKTRIAAKALLDGVVSDMKLLPARTVLGNPVWRSLEVCHALKVEGRNQGMA